MADVIPPTLVDQQQLPNLSERYLARVRKAIADVNAALASLSSGGVPTTRTINTTAPLTGGGDLSADRTLAMPAANAFGAGYLLSSDFNTFNGKEPAIAAGSLGKYWRFDKTFVDLATDVRLVVLTGLSVATATAVAAADSILVAIGKLQAQITALPATASGLYTPTITGVANVASSSAVFGQYLRVGNIVHFSVQVTITPTLATLTSFRFSLPIASVFAANSDGIGDGSANGATQVPALVRGDSATATIFVSFTPTTTAAQGVRVIGSYQVI